MRSTEICDRLQGTWAVQVRAAVATDTQRWVVGGRNGANCRLQVAYTHSPQAASVYYDAVLSVTPAAGQQQLRFFWHALGGSEAGAPPEAVLIHGNGAGLFDGRMFQVEWKNQAGYSFQVIGARE
jgi:hypothetical protein